MTVEFTEERRLQVIALLGVLNDGLPDARGQRKTATAGFVNDPRSRSCPDCLANGRPMKGCETCGGSGTVSPNRVAAIASPDTFPDDGQERDPYMTNETRPYGLTGAEHDRRVALDAAISRAANELRRFDGWRPKSAEDELDDANRNPYPWERERAQIRRRYDIAAITRALDLLRDRDPAGCALLHSVYVYREPWELSTLVEAKLAAALRFVSDRLPDPLRAPGSDQKPAGERVFDRRLKKRVA